MKTWVVVVFGTIEQMTEHTGVAHEATLARMDCRIVYKGEMFTTTLNVKQVTGAMGEPDTIEVEKPLHYNGPLNWSVYSLAATAHYKRAVVSRASVIAVAPAAAAVAMANNTIEVDPSSIVMECDDVQGDAS